jgi:copper(I)-binding protein
MTFRPLFRPLFHLIAPPCLALGIGIGLLPPAVGQEYKTGGITIGHSYARATVPGQPSAGAYVRIENNGKEKDTLQSVGAAIAKSAELHAMAMDGDVMKMREVESIEIKPSQIIAMKPGGGYHIMLIGLNRPLQAGDKFPMTLTFEHAGKVEISVDVVALGKTASKAAAPEH